MILRGHCVSSGAFEGRAHVLDATAWIDAAAAVPAKRSPQGEIERVLSARARAGAQLERFHKQLNDRGRKEDAEIFAAHRMMMRDPSLLERIQFAIEREGLSGEASVARATKALHAELSASPVAMVRDKAADLLDIGHRLLRCLNPRIESQALNGEPTVLISATFTPSELVRFSQQGPCAVLTENCGLKSHLAILARSLGVPIVAGIAGVAERIREGSLVLVDADGGVVLVEPGREERKEGARIRAAIARIDNEPVVPRQPTTRDGVAVALALNISTPQEAELVKKLGATGVGLFRTEFLYMNRSRWPDEEASFALYAATAAALGDGELQIRLADFGSDKCPEYAGFSTGRNPSLGLRGVRLLLQREDILAPQVRAIARIAERRPVTVLVPMLDSVETLRKLVHMLEQLCRSQGGRLPFQLGAMVEVPAAAFSIEAILDEVDLIAIGLNDLTQYLMAADREDESVSDYHDALQPAVLRLVAQVLDAAALRGKPASICGELAGDPTLAPVLLSLGARRLSVSRADYGRMVDVVEGLSIAELEQNRAAILGSKTAAEVRHLVSGLQLSGANP